FQRSNVSRRACSGIFQASSILTADIEYFLKPNSYFHIHPRTDLYHTLRFYHKSRKPSPCPEIPQPPLTRSCTTHTALLGIIITGRSSTYPMTYLRPS